MLLGIKVKRNEVKMLLVAKGTPSEMLTTKYCELTQRQQASTWFSLDGKTEFTTLAQLEEGLFVHD